MTRRETLFWDLMLSAILITTGIAVSLPFTSQNAYATHWRLEIGPTEQDHRGKFIAYADNVEVKGTVMWNRDGNLYVVPDENYYNLVVKGNFFGPNGRFEHPIIKMERYGYCERIDSDECYDSEEGAPIYKDENGTPIRIIDEKGNAGAVQAGDRIKITGVYALDNQHAWYSDLCDFPSARWQGAENVSPKICFNHAEIHPYNASSIVALKPLEPGKPNVESHIVVAPIYSEFYSYTWANNWAHGLSCYGKALELRLCGDKAFTTLVDSSLRASVTSEFFMEAPPKPAECITNDTCILTLQESNVRKIGNAQMLQKIEQPNGYLIRVHAAATDDPYAPSIYQATWSVGWSSENIDLDTSIIRAQDPTGKALNSSSSTPYTSVYFTFSGTENVDGNIVEVKEFECTLDGFNPSPCPGGTVRYDQISPGTHTFQVAAKDAAGVLDKTPATFTWTIQEDFPPICRTRPNLPQCEPVQSQTQEIPPSEESFPEATQRPSDSDDGVGGPSSIDPNTVDADGDGFNPLAGDCDDSNSSVYPGAAEFSDGLDNDCDGMIDNAGTTPIDPNTGTTTTTSTELNTIDQDFDGYSPATGEDCDDSNPFINPAATEIEGNGVDEDCDETTD